VPWTRRPSEQRPQDGQALRAEHHRGQFSYARRDASIAREGRLDGLYVIRTSVPAAAMSAEETVRAYMDLARVEQAFRAMTMTLNLVASAHAPNATITITAKATPLQTKALELLGITPMRVQQPARALSGRCPP
jgi:hypothetical protein